MKYSEIVEVYSFEIYWFTIVDGHGQAANGEEHSAAGAAEVELAQGGDVRELRDDELDGAENSNPGLQRDPAGLQLCAICCCARRMVKPVDAL